MTKPSTKLYLRMSRQMGQSWLQRIHGYVYARWPFSYVGAAIAEKPGSRWLRIPFAPFLVGALFPQRWAAEYHGKVLPTSGASRLVTVQEDLALPQPEQVIPFAFARDLVIHNPQSIVALDCPCRLARKNPCLPLDVCLIIGEPFTSFVLEHHPQHARAISQTEAVSILEAEGKRGHVHHAFFKRSMLNRFYAICNCCTCCCGAMHAQRSGTPMLISSGYVSEVDSALCQACGRCVEICPFNAMQITSSAVVDRLACMGCGVCVEICPNAALALVRDATKPAPLLLGD
ncbi:MAG: 4Fe-4S binding protein [Chloroflexi bacterium]|nr:4Fe-4S binding protein [Chloroflexota bacterium]